MKNSTLQSRLLNATKQNQLAKRLRLIPEERALPKLNRLIAIEPKAGLDIANRVIRSTGFLEVLLKKGLAGANESTCRLWLEVLGRRLGIDRTIKAITCQDDPRRLSAAALYWLPSIFQQDPLASNKIEILKRRNTPIRTESVQNRSFLATPRWGNAA